MAVAIVDTKLLAYNCLYRSQSPVSIINDIVDYLQPLPEVTDILLVFDNGKSDYRLEMWSGYKGKRNYATVSVDATEYLEGLPRVAKALGIPCFMPKGVEADDLAGILCRILDKQGEDIVLVTSDHDWMQMVLLYDRVKLFYVKTKELLGPQEVFEMSGCKTEEQFLIKKAIIGDSGDNILGIPRAGPVTFKTFSEAFFDMPEVNLKAEFLKLCASKSKEGLCTHRDYILEGVHSCEELYDFNIRLGTIMSNLSLLTVEQASHIKGAYAFWKANRKPIVNADEADKVFAKYSKGIIGPFGDPISLNHSYFKELYGNTSN